MICLAGGKDHGPAVPKDHPEYIWSGPNYGKPHVPALGVYAGVPRYSCVHCGKWVEEKTWQRY